MLQTLQDRKAEGKAIPKVLYLVPNGQNPVSYIAPVERKRGLYQVCRKHDLMIVEDDPYFYLQFPYDSKLHCTCEAQDWPESIVTNMTRPVFITPVLLTVLAQSPYASKLHCMRWHCTASLR